MILGCRTRRFLSAFHDGSLRTARRGEVERHLTQCFGCAAELARLEETDRLLRAARPGPDPLPEAVAAAIFERVVVQSGILRRRASRRWLLCVAGLPAGAALAWLTVLGRPPAAPVTPTSGSPMVSASVLAGPRPPSSHSVSERPAAESTAPLLVRSRPVKRVAPRMAGASRRGHRLRMGRGAPLRFRPAHMILARVNSPEPQGPGVAPEAALPAVETPPGGTLLVVMTAGEPQPTFTAQVRCAPPETPGFARVVAWQSGVNGECIRVQATVSSATPGAQLALQAVAGAPR